MPYCAGLLLVILKAVSRDTCYLGLQGGKVGKADSQERGCMRMAVSCKLHYYRSTWSYKIHISILGSKGSPAMLYLA